MLRKELIIGKQCTNKHKLLYNAYLNHKIVKTLLKFYYNLGWRLNAIKLSYTFFGFTDYQTV